MLYKGVLLDIDNTIYEYESAHLAAYETVTAFIAKKYKLPLEEVRELYNQARAVVNKDLHGQAAAHHRLLYFQKILENIQVFPLDALFLHELYWKVFLENMKVREGVYDFLKALQDSSIKVCLITDLISEIQFRKIEALHLPTLIDFIVTSEEVGHEKPHPAIFLRCLTKLNLSKDEVCMIGDDYKKDVVGAVNLGITCYFLSDHDLPSSSSQLVKRFSTFTELREGFIYE
jgi:HAD superfamily hydrolase (TIGR01549 family)